MYVQYFSCRLYKSNYSTFGLNRKYYNKVQNMDTCMICDNNATLFMCGNCKVKCCQPCMNAHQTSCGVMKERHFHMCKEHCDQQVAGYCQHCSELICKNCRTVGHKHHDILPIKTAFDNCRKAMSKVWQDLDMKYDQLKSAMEIPENSSALVKQIEEDEMRLPDETKTNFGFLENELCPITFLLKWSDIHHALTKYKQLQSTTTERPQSDEHMTSHVPDVSKTFGNSVK